MTPLEKEKAVQREILNNVRQNERIRMQNMFEWQRKKKIEKQKEWLIWGLLTALVIVMSLWAADVRTQQTRELFEAYMPQIMATMPK